MNVNKNVILYPRVSWSKQSKYWESLEYQEEQCRAFCGRSGYQVLAVFKEQFTWVKDKRPKLEEALEFIKNSELKIDHVIVFRVDRVSRWGIVVHESFKEQFKALWVTVKDTFWVITEDKNALEIKWINTSKYNWAKDTTNKLTENVTVMMSENERNTILQRMLWQSIRNWMRGYKTRNSDFWFKNKKVMTPMWKKTIQVENKEESIFIKRMFELKARWDLSDKEITEEINLMGYKSRQRDKWNSNKTEIVWIIGWNQLTSEQLQRYIKSPIYAWIICEEWTWNRPIKAPYEWLVSIELWNKANRWRYKINILNDEEIHIEYYNWEIKLEDAPIIQKPKNYNPDYPFWKVLECPLCWWHLTAEKSKSRNWKYHHYYSCRGKKWIKHTNYSLRRDIVNKEIIEIFSKLNIDDEWFELFEYISEQVFKDRKMEYTEMTKDKEKQIEELKDKQKRIWSNISKLIDYPELLETQNEELQLIKKEIWNDPYNIDTN